MKLKISALLLVFLFFLVGCLHEKEETLSTIQPLTVQSAKAIYDAASISISTKVSSDREKNNMFFRETYEPDWKTALPTRTDDVESVDVPVNEQRLYYVTTHDGQGFYLTGCHHSITIVRSVKTGNTGVYHHFFIPFRDSRDKYRDSYDGELYRGFHNNGYRDDFSGLEIYSNRTGRIIKYLWYVNGKRLFSAYAGDSPEKEMKIGRLMKYYIVKGYGILHDIHTKDGTQYHCPQCGHELYEIDGYYYCSECDWNEMDFWQQYLEECYIYGEGGGSGGNDGGDDPDPLNPDPDPNTGGGGNNGSGSGTGGYDQGDIPENFHFVSNQDTIVLPAFLRIINDCAGEALINELAGYQINFNWSYSCSGLISTVVLHNLNHDTYYLSGNINYCAGGPIASFIVFEELFHCIQVNNSDYSNDWKMNVEVEAKFASYLYAMHTGDSSIMNRFRDAYGSFAPFEYYRQHPEDSVAYLDLVQVVRSQDPVLYGNITENASHRQMNNLATIFDCYE